MRHLLPELTERLRMVARALSRRWSAAQALAAAVCRGGAGSKARTSSWKRPTVVLPSSLEASAQSVAAVTLNKFLN